MLTEQDIRREYVSGFEASQILKVNESRIRQILGEGRLPGSFKFADTWLIPRASVIGYTRGKPGKKKAVTREAESKKKQPNPEWAALSEEEKCERLASMIHHGFDWMEGESNG